MGRIADEGMALAASMAYSSAAFHWFVMRSGQPDPAPIPTQWVFAIKVAGLLVFVGALFLTVTSPLNEKT